MAWFERKRKEPEVVEPTPEEKAAAALAALRAKLEQTLKTDPVFQVMTVDGLAWICPWTGTTVPAPFDALEPARDYLVANQPWTRGTPLLTLERLRLLRWEMYLRQQLEFEPWLRTFASDGRWLNPFNGQWVGLSGRGTTIDAAMIEELARHLMQCPEAQGGKRLDSYRLQEIVREERGVRSKGGLPDPTRAHTRASGTRASHTDLPPLPQGGETVVDEDLAKAERIVDKMLAPLPTVPGYGFVVHYEPHSQVGGDFYECQEIAPSTYFLALGDVSGHGVQGALVVVAALKSLRFVLRSERDLIGILARLNDEVRPDLVSGQFLTMFAAILDASHRTLTCVCAGHHPALLIGQRRRTVVSRIGSGGAAIGLMRSELLRRTLKPETVQLEPGDTLLVYTDGLSEVHNYQGQEYGDLRVVGSALTAIHKPPNEVVRDVVRDARQFASGVMHDDVTVISLSIDPPAAATDGALDDAATSDPQPAAG